MRRLVIASIAVGINDSAYAEGWAERPTIRFAEADAEAFTAYVLRAWPTARPEYVLSLIGGAATTDRIRATLEDVGTRHDIDLLIVYLSGHGVVDEATGRAWFCTAEGTVDDPGLDAGKLAILLRLCNARRVLLFLDCCYAHRIVGPCQYFGDLENSEARLYICSAGGRERSWEDEGARHGIFSAVLLSILTRSSDRTGLTQPGIRVQQELVPMLRERVPTAADALKRRPQQPVAGGPAHEDILLPTTSSGGGWQPPPALVALRKRFFKLVRLVVVICVAGALLVQLNTFHIGLNRGGGVSVELGTSWLRPFWPSGVSERVDLGLGSDELQVGPSARWAALRGLQWGIWSHRDGTGIRIWFERLIPLLADRAKSRLQMLVVGQAPLQSLSTALKGIQPWQLLDAADAARLTHTQPPPYLASLFVPAPSDFTVLDFEALSRSSVGIVTLAEAAVSLSLVVPEQGAEALNSVRRTVAYRLARGQGTTLDIHAEVSAIERAYAKLAAEPLIGPSVLAIPMSSLDVPVVEDRLTAACACAHGTTALTAAQRTEVVARLMAFVTSYSRDSQGNALTYPQAAALHALVASATVQPLDEATLNQLWSLGGEHAAYEHIPEIGEFLEALSDVQPLSEQLRALLLARVREPQGDWDFFAVRAMQVLATNARFLESAERDTTALAIIAFGSEVEQGPAGLTPTFALVLGSLGASGVDVSAWGQQVRQALQVAWSTPAASRDYELLGSLVEWSDMPFAVALARGGRAFGQLPRLAEDLRLVATLRPHDEGREEIIAFLTEQALAGNGLTASDARARLAEYATDAGQRRVEVDMLCTYIRCLPKQAREELTREFREQWRKEQEPEIRVALAEILLEVG